MLFVSKNLPARVTEKWFASGTGNPLIVTDVLEERLFNDFVALQRLRQDPSRSLSEIDFDEPRINDLQILRKGKTLVSY
jgi:hypothetical protein